MCSPPCFDWDWIAKLAAALQTAPRTSKRLVEPVWGVVPLCPRSNVMSVTCHVLRSCCRTKPKPPPGDYDMKILPFVPLRRGVLGPTGRTILCLVDVSFREVLSGVAEEHWRVAIDQRESSQETLGKRKLRQNSEWFVVCGWWSLTWSRRIAVLGEAAVDEAHNSFIGKGCNHPTFVYWCAMHSWMNLVDLLHFW